MGDPRKKRKQFEKPKKVWDSERLARDKKLKETYGLKNMRELWRMETFLKKKRQNARKMLALSPEERKKREKELIQSLAKLGLLRENAVLDDVLGLKVEALLERRLQTIVWRKNLALTPKQARQFIVHGKIAVDGRKVTIPSFLVTKELENKIGYFKEPMQLTLPQKKTQAKVKEEKSLKEEFEEAKPFEELTEDNGE